MLTRHVQGEARALARLARQQWRSKEQPASFSALRSGDATVRAADSRRRTRAAPVGVVGPSLAAFNSDMRARRWNSSMAMAIHDESENDSGSGDDIVPFKLTDIGEGILEVELLQWFVQPGDQVKQFDRVCEVQSDKANVEISSRYDGTITKLHHAPGDMVKTGATLMDVARLNNSNNKAIGGGGGVAEVLASRTHHAERLSVPHAAAPASAAAGVSAVSEAPTSTSMTAATPNVSILTTPAVRRLAKEHNVNLAKVLPTGPHGRLLKADVLRFIEQNNLLSAAATTTTAVNSAAAVALPLRPTLQFPGGEQMANGFGLPGRRQQPPPPLTTLVPKQRQSDAAAAAASAGSAAGSAAAVSAAKVVVSNSEVGIGGRSGFASGYSPETSRDAAAATPLRPVSFGEAAPGTAAAAEPTMISGRWTETHAATPGQTVPIRGIQKAMFETMTRSLMVPHMVFCDEVVMDAAVALRNDLKAVAAAQGLKLTQLPILIKATSMALKKYPLLNSSLTPDNSAITYHKDHNIGVAMDTPRGLLVPNVKAVQEKSLFDVARELNRLQALGSEGKLSTNDLAGGTFTLSNIGSIGGTYAAPVILHPQVAIGAMGKMKRVPRFDENDNGKIVAQTLLLVSWAADHRIVDGGTMARFSNLWRSYLENPAAMLGESR